MKTLSLKLDDDIFTETEEITERLKMARNRYINEALRAFNEYQKRKALKNKLLQESRGAYGNSLAVLEEFERILDAD
ncbi:ribbon-helix-helix domain-containing protein [Pedobacter sp.]